MFIGIDLGTTDVKVVLLSPEHELVASHRVPIGISRPHALWSEQDPREWWSALDSAMTALAGSSARHLARVRAIGLAGQMHGAVLLDKAGAVLRPAILWNDGRSTQQCLELERAVPEMGGITGNRAMPGFTAPKLLWVRENEPALFDRLARVLLPKDYLRLRLTGDAITDCSDASGTLWLDVGRRNWSMRMLMACGLDRDQMPALVEGGAPAGTLRTSLAVRWGLPRAVVVAGGAGDNAASAVGSGAIAPGDGFVSLGTSGVIFVVTAGFLPNPGAGVHAFCHALSERWHQMSVMLSAASCLQWATHLTGAANEAALIERAAGLSLAERARAPLFLPYLSGERTPHNDAHAKGMLFGLTHDHGAAAIAWSVLEGVSFGLCDGYRVLDVGKSPKAGALALLGGGARSALWAGLLASVLNVPLRTRTGSEAAGALGAARLGWLAAGGVLDEVVRQDGADSRIILPDPEMQRIAAPRYERFRALYSAVKDEFIRT